MGTLQFGFVASICECIHRKFSRTVLGNKAELAG
jgi:hypothetical protein